jgi:hypothetical protein
VGAAIYIKTARRKGKPLRLRRAATVSWRKEKRHIPPTTAAGKHAKEEMRKRKQQTTPKPTAGKVFSSSPIKPHLSFAAALRGQRNNQPIEEVKAARNSEPAATKPNVQETGQSVQAQDVNSDSLDIFRAFSVVKQIMAEIKGTASEEAKFVALAKIVFKFKKKMANRVHRPLKVIAYNANGILRQRSELGKQLQDLHIYTCGSLFRDTSKTA